MTPFPTVLRDGYRAFKTDGYVRNRALYRSLAEHGQTPDCMVIACCDSRSAPETVFNAAPGSIFVARTVANLVQPYQRADSGTAAALEFAVWGLKVQHIVVLGHGRCGGIRTLLKPSTSPLSPDDCIGRWLDPVRPILRQRAAGRPLDDAELQTELERAVIRDSVANLRTYPGLADLEHRHRLHLHGAWFDIAEGTLWTMDPSTQEFSVTT